MKDIDTMYSGDIPVGGWRDRLTDFLTLGVFHPVLWTTIFCPLCKYVVFILHWELIRDAHCVLLDLHHSDARTGHDSSKV